MSGAALPHGCVLAALAVRGIATGRALGYGRSTSYLATSHLAPACVSKHPFNNLRPPNRRSQLQNQILFDRCWVGMWFGVYVLVDWTNWGFEFRLFDSFLQFFRCGLHQWRMECTAHFQG
jgi:hypothetical protein